MTLPDHTPFPGTPEQAANLALLADRLEEKADLIAFDMDIFSDVSEWPCEPHPCGTPGCIIGNAPLLGFDAQGDEEYGSYSFRLFCPRGDCWEWLFSSDWADADNSLSGAIARIRYTLKHGYPDNWEAQMLGEAPLSYIKAAP